MTTSESSVSDRPLSTAELFYLLYFCLMLAAKGLGQSEGQPLYDLCLAAAALCFLAKLMLTRYTMFELLGTILLLGMTMFVYLRTGERGIVFYMAMALGLKGVSLKRVFRTGAWLLSVCFLLMMALTQSGLIGDLFYVHHKDALGFTVRWSFGYTHPNVLHITYLVLMALWLYVLPLTRKQLRAVSVFFMLGNLYVLLYSLSYTGFIVGTFYLFCNYYFTASRPDSGLRRLANALAGCLFPFCVLFSVAGPVILTGKLYELADKLVHHRFVLSNYFLTTEPVALFGHRLLTTPDATRSIDCSYTYLFVHLGVVFFAMFCLVYMAMILRCIRQNNGRTLAILLGFALAGVTEPFLFNTSFKNITFLLIGAYLFFLADRLSHRLPAFWRREIALGVFGKIGSKEIIFSRRETAPIRKHEDQTDTFPNRNDKSVSVSDQKEDSAAARSLSRLLLFSCGAAFLAAMLYLLAAPRPSAVLIPSVYCTDGYESDPQLYTQEEIDALDSSVIVLSWNGSSEEMALFTGSTPHLEFVRRTVSCGVWTWLAIFGAGHLLQRKRTRHS
ncbi:MAG: hypothetical protein Q4C60_01995 [Eubacteriales bacterium]|nr:hypothetical protein [Eubacteriales bacterium]